MVHTVATETKHRARWASVVIGILVLAIFSLSGTQALARGAEPGLKPYPRGPASFSELVNKVKDVVVNISSTKIVRRGPLPHPFGPRGPFREFFGEDFFERFFGEIPREQKQRSLGSGFIIDPEEGFIFTNNHVIANADEIKVRLDNGKEYEAEVVGRDPKTDLALIKTREKLGVSHGAPLGDSDQVQVGQWVMAIGNPFGLERTVTVGIISAKGRVIGAGPYDDFLQTDAAINPGNSGGPLFNMEGEVVGINTAIVASGQGIGFAIPANMATELLPQLKQGKVIRGWLGVSIQKVTPELAESFNLEEAEGALVADVVKDSPAERGGIKRGDIITAFDGKDIESPHELSRIVAGTSPERRVKVKVLREGETKTLNVTLGTMPEDFSGIIEKSTAELGLSVQNLTPELAEQFGWARDEKGVLITAVDPGSPGDEAGLRRGDLVKEVNRETVDSVSEYREALKKDRKAGRSILFLVKREDQTFFASVEPESR
ncbi:MAG: DegQ family serine endoprotease [Syntrophobacteria bacterium]